MPETGNRYGFSTQPTLQVTSTNVAKNYGVDATPTVAAAYTITGFVNAATFGNVFTQDTTANAITGSPTVTSLGSAALANVSGSPYAITVDAMPMTAATGYKLSAVSSGLLTVNPAVINLAGSRSYDGTSGFAGVAFGAAGTINTGIGGQTLLVGGNGTVGSPNVVAGVQTLTTGTLTLADGTGLANNYTLAGGTHTGTITARAITVTATNATRVYDGTTASAVSPTVVSGSIAAGDTANFTQTYNNRNVGASKLLTPAGSVNDGAGGANYAVTLTPAAVGTITPAALTVSAATDVKTYDGTIASAGVPLIMSGSLFGADSATLSQTYANSNAGTGKSLIPSAIITDGNSSNNYQVMLVNNNTGVINARPIVVTPTSGLTKIYGNSDPALGYAVTGGNLVNADTLSGALARVSGEDAGSYLITRGALGNSNYAITLSPVNFAITPAALTVRANDATREIATPNPPFAANYTGFVSGEGPANLAGSLNFFTPATVNSPEGRYLITPSGLSSANYAIRYFDGVLELRSASRSISHEALFAASQQSVALGNGVSDTGSVRWLAGACCTVSAA